MAESETPVQQGALVACKRCNRSFTADAIRRHEPVCLAGALKNRKQFDSHQQRIEGDDDLRPYRVFVDPETGPQALYTNVVRLGVVVVIRFSMY